MVWTIQHFCLINPPPPLSLFCSFRTWRCWRLSFIPKHQALTLRSPGTVGVAAAMLTRLAHAHPQVRAGRSAAGSCGRTRARWRKITANSMPCSFAWMSPRKSCWKSESKKDTAYKSLWVVLGVNLKYVITVSFGTEFSLSNFTST